MTGGRSTDRPRGLGLVIGASGGIGAACAERLQRHVAALVLTRRRVTGDEAAGDVWIECDLTEPASRTALVDRVVERELPLRFVVLAAGVPFRSGVAEASPEAWHSTMEANVVGPALVLSDLLARAEWSTPASVVGIGSLSARRALPARALYGATKAAFEQFLRCAAVEVAPRGIHVNVLSVGVVDTEFLAGGRDTLAAHVESRIPVGRMASPDEIGRMAELAVLAPPFLTGATIAVDGGAGTLG